MSPRIFMIIAIVIVSAVLLGSQFATKARNNLNFRGYSDQAGITPGIGSSSTKVDKQIYVPAYSHIYGNGGQPYLLEVTLSIRNIDPSHPIFVNSVKYYSTSGELVKVLLDHPHEMAPLATMEFLVEEQDTSGGSGANFIVEWSVDQGVNKPLIEAVMVGTGPNSSFAFVRSGVELQD